MRDVIIGLMSGFVTAIIFAGIFRILFMGNPFNSPEIGQCVRSPYETNIHKVVRDQSLFDARVGIMDIEDSSVELSYSKTLIVVDCPK